MDDPQQLTFRDLGADKCLVCFVTNLVGNYANTRNSELLSQSLYIFVGLYTSGSRFDDNHKLIHSGSSAATQVFQPGFHVENDDIFFCQHQIHRISSRTP